MSDGDSRTVPCEFCGDPVNPNARQTWHRVIGWERKGQAGGSDIALRERHGETFACDFCISRLKAKLSPGQGSLL